MLVKSILSLTFLAFASASTGAEENSKRENEANKRSYGYYRPHYGYGNRYYKREYNGEYDLWGARKDGGEVNKRSYGYYRPHYGYGNHYYKRDYNGEYDLWGARKDGGEEDKRDY